MPVRLPKAFRLFAIAGMLASAALTVGCQSNIGGQTLPSAWYLTDDVQYFPAGPEFLLPEQVQALEEYRAAEAGLEADVIAP